VNDRWRVPPTWKTALDVLGAVPLGILKNAFMTGPDPESRDGLTVMPLVTRNASAEDIMDRLPASSIERASPSTFAGA
jgi:hypothetical protein